VNTLKRWRHLLEKDSGAMPSIVGEGKLDHWIQLQRQHEADHPLAINNPNFFAPMKEISITAVPLSEQGVVVLFNQLIAGGVIRGMKLMATSSHQQYDGIYRFMVKEPLQNHLFDKEANPLGVQTMQHTSEFSSKSNVLEYKQNVDALIQEFESQEKQESDISLVVAWTSEVNGRSGIRSPRCRIQTISSTGLFTGSHTYSGTSTPVMSGSMGSSFPNLSRL
jgi:hypothetical protein